MTTGLGGKNKSNQHELSLWVPVPAPLVNHFVEILPQNSYPRGTTLIYPNQTPFVAYLMIDGELVLFNQKQDEAYRLKKGELLGVRELLHHEIIPYEVHISQDSLLAHLDRSTLLEILEENGHDERRKFLSELIYSS